jgi:hypothetical protein
MNLRVGQLYKPKSEVCLYNNEYLVFSSLSSEPVETAKPNDLCVILDIKNFSHNYSLRILKPNGKVGWIMYLE